jgi:hypothetical protein
VPTLDIPHLALAPAPRRRRALPLAREPHDAGRGVRCVVSAARRGVHDAGPARFVRFHDTHVDGVGEFVRLEYGWVRGGGGIGGNRVVWTREKGRWMIWIGGGSSRLGLG